MKISEFNNLTIKEAAIFYYDFVGANPVPINPKTKAALIEWDKWQHERMPRDYLEQLCNYGYFNEDNGIGLVAGKLYDKNQGNYLVGVDADNITAVEAIRTTIDGKKLALEDFTKEGIIAEGHSDKSYKIHFLYLCRRPVKSLSSTAPKESDAPSMQIMSRGEFYIVAPPSLSNTGVKRQIIAYENQDLIFNFSDTLDKRIDQILSGYGIPYLSSPNNGSYKLDSNGNIPIAELFKEDTRIYEGQGRRPAILRVMESLLKRNYGILSLPEIREMAQTVNLRLNVPPLDEALMEKQWKDATKFIGKKVEAEVQLDEYLNKLINENQKEKQDQSSGSGDGYGYEKYDELKGNIYYKINDIPEIYIIAYRQKNRLIEARIKVDIKSGTVSLIHTKAFLACIPIKIVRHKNPLTFLQTQATFTISFVDAIGEHYIFTYRPLSTIVQSLKDAGLVLGDGADTALSAMIEAFKQRSLIEDNEDIEYIGFLPIDNKIVVSNLEINEPSITKLSDALSFIEELRVHYEKRLDLLTTSIHWGLFAPFNLIVKNNNYFLKLFHFSGISNSTKSNTGKIILGIDGHHKDRMYATNFDRVDTQPRFTDAVSRSTFPVLIDEVPDLTNEQKYDRFIISLKTAAESQILRTKFPNSKARMTEDYPAMSCIILTSNFAPPIRNSGLMRRMITRNFPKEESWNPSDPRTKTFEIFLQTNLPRLKALGDFRNWYIMNHQEIILNNEGTLNPLDIGLMILKAAYEATGKIIPEWLVNQRLPENQLEESIEESDVIVKGAFQKLINERIGKALYLWNLGKDKDTQYELPRTITSRLVALARNNFLEYVKYVPEFPAKKIKEGIKISTGILGELYNYGVGKDQLPHLTTLANYMKGEYRKSDGKSIIFVDLDTIGKFFDPKDEQNGDLRIY